MDCVDLRRDFTLAIRLCFDGIPECAARRVRELPDLFRARTSFARRDIAATFQRGDSASKRRRAVRRRTAASLCGLRGDGIERSEPRFSCLMRRRGILHGAPAEAGDR